MPLQILLLEDSPLDADRIKAVLLRGGLECKLRQVKTRLAFVRALKPDRVDLVLANYAPAGWDGLAALAIARQRCPEVPFIFISDRLGEELAVEAIQQGATDYVLKQRLERLGPCVQRALQTAQELCDRQNAETALCESEAKYQTLFHAIDEGFIICDVIFAGDRPVDLLYLEANDAAVRMTGQALVGRRTSEISPDFAPEWFEILGSVARTGEAIRMELPATPQNLWYEFYAFRIEATNHQRVAVIYKDISARKQLEAERKQAEITIRDSEERFRNMADHAPVMVWVTDPTGYCTYLSQSWYDFSGQTEATGLGFGWLDVVHPDDRDSTRATFLAANARHAAFRLEYRLRRHDGEYHWMIDAASPWLGTDGQFKGYIGSMIDISDRKQTEQALRESAEKYRSLFESLDQGFCLLEVLFDSNNKAIDYCFIEINKAFEQQSSLVNATGKTILELVPNLEPQWAELYGQVARAGEAVRFEADVPSMNRIFDIYAFPSGAPGQNLVAVLFADITERKRREANLTFLTDLAKEFSQLSTAKELIQAIGIKLGAYLKVTACNFCEVDEARDEVIYLGRWTVDDAPPLPNRLRLSEQVSEAFYHQVRAGEIVVSNNTQTNSVTKAQANAAIGVRSFITVPFHQDGYWKYLFSVHDRVPRTWREDEIELVRELAERFFPRLERARAEAKLAASEEKYRSILTTVDEGLLIAEVLFDDTGETIDYRCLEVNPAFYVQTGLTMDVVGLTMREIAPGKPIPWLPMYGQVVRSQQGIRFEYDIKLEELRGYYDVHILPLGPPSDHRVAVLFKNITDRKQAEQKIREQAALLDITSDAIFVRDLDHRILYWNQGATKLYGWQPTEVIGQSAYPLLQEETDRLPTIMQTLLTEGEWHGELHKTTKTRNVVTVESRWTLVRNEANQPKFILSVDTDITQKKQLEAQFYRAQRLESLGTLASGVAHDLNNVLTPILAITQILRSQYADIHLESQEMFDLIESSARRGANLIKQILTFTRGTGGERQPIQVLSLVQEFLKIIQQSFPKTITLRQRLPEAWDWVVSADSTALHQILMNLCINARDAMPNGGVLSVTVEYCFVDHAVTQTNLDAQIGHYIVLTVADTGTGIPPEVRDRIFDPFFTTKPPGQGTGLGLATVLGIIKEYGGFLQVMSKVNQGTQMKVYLPCIKGESLLSDLAEQSLDGNGDLLLLVDDDVIVQQSLQSLLENYNYCVLTANNGIDAIALYTQHHQDIKFVLSDITMPTMSGILLIQRLREINPIVKTIAMSALPSNREPALAAGATLFLAKPFTIKNLIQSLKTLSIPLEPSPPKSHL